MSAQDRDLIAAATAPFLADPPRRIGLAVSGGGDSMALLHFLAQGLAGTGIRLDVLTVDHGLRPESAAEAEFVAKAAAALGIAHRTLRWTGWDGQGNLQDSARRARLDLLTGWARANGVPALALGHTADDQAETVVMRLARGAGVDGLSAIPERREEAGVTLIRPLLGLRRADLRDYLTRRGVSWVEDPSNEDARYERVRIRRAIAGLGLEIGALADVANHMRQARAALDWSVHEAARELAAAGEGCVSLDAEGVAALPPELRRRLLDRSLRWVAGAGHPPRAAALAEAIEAVTRGRAATLAGCHVLTKASRIWIVREYAAVRDREAGIGAVWDGRWRAEPPAGVDAAVFRLRALGDEGLALLPDWRAAGRPREAMKAAPGVWRQGELAAAPVPGCESGWRIRAAGDQAGYLASLLSH